MSCKHCGRPSGLSGRYSCVSAARDFPVITPCEKESAINVTPPAAEAALSDSERRKRTPVYSGVMAYFPDALQAVARVSWKGNEKHNPGKPLHWSRHKSSDHADCAARHLLTPDEIDPDSGETHLAHAVWRALAMLQLQEEARRTKQ